MRKLLLLWVGVLALLCGAAVQAKVLGVEFNFAAFTGDLAKDKVELVPGKVVVFVNNVPVAQQDISKQSVPVIFDNREVGGAVWITAKSMGPSLRRGKNKLRVEFQPAGAAPYAMQLRWAFVTDQVKRTETGPGQGSATNQADEGADNRKGLTGKLVVEREFSADFPDDLPWHRYPPVTALTDADKQALAALVAARAQTFKPDFAAVYQMLDKASVPGMQLNVAGIKKSKVLDQGYAAGVRITAPAVDKIEFTLTGNPEVVLRGNKGADLYPMDVAAIKRVKGEEARFGVGMVLSVLYPQQMVVVRDPAGQWQVAY